MSKVIPFEKIQKRLMARPDVRREMAEQEPEFAIARQLIAARVRAKMSQAEVATLMKTTQSVVARLESGNAFPSTKSLMRYAAATGSKVKISLVSEKGRATA